MSATTGIADLQLANLRPERLRCHTSLVSGVLTLRFLGSGESSDLALLTRLLESAHSVAIDHRAGKAVIDLEHVRYMSPSCFGAFQTWVRRVNAMPAGQRYAVHFKLNRAGRWQMNTLPGTAFGAITFD
ncbi:MAG: hypothetical protein QM723_11005 [Myxococcaceae bacterium]